ncbi:MAG: alpha/beta fold hydrolase [bacterium]|nr:alpha/beta fold hydrolase [bacterium]
MTHRIRSRLAPPIVLALALAFAAAARAEPPVPAAAGHWEGAIVLPGQELGIKVDLAADGGAWSGTIDIPMQGATGLPLENVRAAGDSLVFAIAKVPGAPTFRGLLADGRLSGDFTQNGMTFPFRLGREAGAAPERPQEPQPPFPYRTEEVTYRNGDVVLAGTLTLPEGPGPFPAAVLLTGSGAQNRDEELFAHKPFLVLADHLTRAGVAVLRADDRGVGGSTGSVSLATTADFAQDALAGVALLRARPDIAGGCVGLIGHSEGGIAAPLAAANAPDAVDFVVLLAGTGVPLGEVILRQAELIMKAGGTDSTTIADELAQTRLALGRLAAGADSAAIRADLEQLALAQQAAHPDRAKDPAALKSVLDAAVSGMITPWFRYAAALDPREALRRLRCPVLALNGGRDLQVDPDQNLTEIERALREGGNPDLTIRRLPGLNHLLQTAATGHPGEYGQIAETMSPVALDAVRDWILARCPAR